LALTALAAGPFARAAADQSLAKDTGPASGACDGYAKGTSLWKNCVGAASAEMSDAELFYAGYWLAKKGQYHEALAYLGFVQTKDERVLTYLGFATRKLGDTEAALPLYARALEINPDYSVARAYLGEAFLSQGAPDKARAELAEIERRCGRICAAYADLAGHIARYEAAAAGRG
jgi:tetratricopeptide (TPR) repeat protein